MHYDLRPVDQVLHPEMLDQVPRHTYQISMALRDEQRRLASDAVAYVRYQKSRNASKQRIAKERDLVVVRNHAVKARGEKIGEQMVWASHLGFLHRIWLIGVRQRASRIWEDKEVSPQRPTLVKPSERFQVE